MPNPLQVTDIPNLTKKGVKIMPHKGEYSKDDKKKGVKEGTKEAHMMIMGNPMRKKHRKYSMGE